MFKIVIADDEAGTLEGISSCLNWDFYNIKVSGKARNGLQALQLARDIKPDILLTDIKMPKMDGTKLAKILKEELPDLKVIFITGYSDISYIKSAFKHDVIDYILKPVDPDELGVVISKVIETCRNERTVRAKQIESEVKIRQGMPLLQEKFFKFLISDELKDRNDILHRMEFLEIDLFRIGFYTVLAIYIDDYYLQENSRPLHKKRLMAFSIINIILKVINNFTKGVAFENNENEFVAIISFSTEIEECTVDKKIGIIANDIKDNLNSELKLSVTIGIGECVARIERVPFSYQRAMLAANQKLFLGKDRIIHSGSIRYRIGSEDPINMKSMENIYTALRLGNYERLEVFTNEVFNKLGCKKAIDKQYIQGVCLQMISICNRVINESDRAIYEERINIYSLVNHLFKLETLEDMKSFLLSTFKKLCDNIGISQHNSSQKVVEKIKSKIYEEYFEDISINSIAKDVYLTPSYICFLFRQETGETINDFLTKVRIEKAKELLNGRETKVYEISKKVGYNDPKYFSKLFKKFTGVNPSEYNKLNTI